MPERIPDLTIEFRNVVAFGRFVRSVKQASDWAEIDEALAQLKAETGDRNMPIPDTNSLTSMNDEFRAVAEKYAAQGIEVDVIDFRWIHRLGAPSRVASIEVRLTGSFT
jgi:hypothetical protein